MTSAAEPGCPLCDEGEGATIWSNADWRMIRAEEEDFPGTYRLIHRGHVRELSGLGEDEIVACARLLAAAETALIEGLHPDKVNLASLGNVVPHLHWHLIPRFVWDSRFPDAVWAAPRREVLPTPSTRLGSRLEGLDARVRDALERVT